MAVYIIVQLRLSMPRKNKLPLSIISLQEPIISLITLMVLMDKADIMQAWLLELQYLV
ncbi:hypothetical protein [Bacillus nakamurai]|uniref:hypothetical protein n=1 Tax=Bacillus nakamurai TaxID=1793963 RepID=UPI000B037234|nr:hypothetical protein [Bacillus nakamurai]MCP6684168.1 hypothetical protein [Bacillus nakamurai]MED1229744.1 hypothetical protein [Bacillus nakamurai]